MDILLFFSNFARYLLDIGPWILGSIITILTSLFLFIKEDARNKLLDSIKSILFLRRGLFLLYLIVIFLIYYSLEQMPKLTVEESVISNGNYQAILEIEGFLHPEVISCSFPDGFNLSSIPGYSYQHGQEVRKILGWYNPSKVFLSGTFSGQISNISSTFSQENLGQGRFKIIVTIFSDNNYPKATNLVNLHCLACKAEEPLFSGTRRMSGVSTGEEIISQDIYLNKGVNTFTYYYQDLGQNSTNPEVIVVIPKNVAECSVSPNIEIDYHPAIFNWNIDPVLVYQAELRPNS
jgi:hypothetical protein